jgi:signal transduction histidine kinase
LTSFRAQLALTTMALTAVGLLVVSVGLQLTVHHIVEGNVSRVLEDRADAVVGAVRAASARDGLVVPEGVLDPGVVVYDGDGRLLAGISSTAVREDADRLGRAGRRATLDVDEEERLLARPFTTPGGADGTVVVSEPLRPYEQTELYVGLASLLVGLLVVLAVGLITRWVTTRSLAPVGQMAERAADWSEHDLAHRFGLGPPVNELTALGATLDGLLERVARTIRAEQRLTAELAHELRTPLTAIQGAADLALLRGGLDPEVRRDLEQVAGSSRTMARTITTLLELARDPAPGERPACSVGELVAAVGVLVPPGTALEDRTGPSRDLRVAAPLDLALRALAPLVENAARHGRSRVTLSVRAEGASVHLEVGDDGPGVDPQVRERLFAPGTSGPAGGTGLGLGIARRVARSLGGEVSLAEAGASGGATFVLRLPRL